MAMDIHCAGIESIIAFFTQSRSSLFAPARHVISNVVVEGERR
jgi:hypothetical protein